MPDDDDDLTAFKMSAFGILHSSVKNIGLYI